MFLLFVTSSSFGSGNLHRRLQISLEITDKAQADSAVDLISGASGIKTTELWTGENYKIVDATKTFDGTVYRVGAVYLFDDDTIGLNHYSRIAGAVPVGFAGKVSLHFCPVEGSIKTGWLGCKNDPRADYKETTFP